MSYINSIFSLDENFNLLREDFFDSLDQDAIVSDVIDNMNTSFFEVTFKIDLLYIQDKNKPV